MVGCGVEGLEGMGRKYEEMLKNMNEIQKSATFVVCT